MKFLVRKRRSAPAVIIVALIDVLIVLVIFLLVTTTFKQAPTLRLTLPESAHALKAGATENPPIVVTVDTNGVLRLTNQRLSLNEMPQTLEQLQADFAEAAKNPDVKLDIRADKSAPWGKVAAVIDAATEAHIKVIRADMKEPGKP